MWREVCGKFACWLLRVSGSPQASTFQHSATIKMVSEAAREAWLAGACMPRLILRTPVRIPFSEHVMEFVITDFGVIALEVENCPGMSEDDPLGFAAALQALQEAE